MADSSPAFKFRLALSEAGARLDDAQSCAPSITAATRLAAILRELRALLESGTPERR